VDSACEGVDVIVHLAGTPDDSNFLCDILPNNVQGMHNLLQAAVAHRSPPVRENTDKTDNVSPESNASFSRARCK
jgi:hypothetical protein